MSGYMSRLFPRSNSSFHLSAGTAIQAKVVRLRDQLYLVDAGVAPPRVSTREELVLPKSKPSLRFTNRLGYLTPSSHETQVPNRLLERAFVDLLTGDPLARARATGRFSDMLGENDVGGGGDQPLMFPRAFRKKRVLTELRDAWRSNKKVKGFVAAKNRGGYSIAIAGYLAHFPTRSLINRRGITDRFIIERFNEKKMDILVTGA